MTDDRKPRKFEIFYSGLAGTFSVRNNLDAHIMSEREDLSDEYIRLIELEPTLQLMKEMCAKLLEAQTDDREMIMNDLGYPGFDGPISIHTKYDDVIEKYRKFLEVIEK